MGSSTKRHHGLPPTAEHYRQYRRQIVEKGITKRHSMLLRQRTPSSLSKHGLKGNTPNQTGQCHRRSSLETRFYEFMNEEPLTYLVRSSKEDIIIFLKWLHDNTHITKLTTAQEYKRVYFILYRHDVLVTACMQKSHNTSMTYAWFLFRFATNAVD